MLHNQWRGIGDRGTGCFSPGPWTRQNGEWQIFQSAGRDDEQPLPAQLGRDRTQQHLAQSRSLRPIVSIRLLETPLMLSLGFASSGLARGQQVIDAARSDFNLSARRQLITGDGVWGHGPEKAAILTQRILQQQRVFVEHLPLNFRDAEWLRLRER